MLCTTRIRIVATLKKTRSYPNRFYSKEILPDEDKPKGMVDEMITKATHLKEAIIDDVPYPHSKNNNDRGITDIAMNSIDNANRDTRKATNICSSQIKDHHQHQSLGEKVHTGLKSLKDGGMSLMGMKSSEREKNHLKGNENQNCNDGPKNQFVKTMDHAKNQVSELGSEKNERRDSIESKAQDVKEQGKEMLETGVDSVRSGVESAKSKGGDVFEYGKDNVKSMKQKTNEHLHNIGQAVKDTIPDASDGTNMTTRGVQNVKESSKKGIEKTKDKLKGTKDLQHGLSSTAEQIVSKGQQFAQKGYEIAEDMFEKSEEMVHDAKNSVKGMMNNAMEEGKQKASNQRNGL
jgi:hypothetical protein